MGSGHSRHSKSPDHGAAASQILAELREAAQALRLVKKALARADARLHQIPPSVLNHKTHAWIAQYQGPLVEASKFAAALRTVLNRALAIAPPGRADDAPLCACSHHRTVHQVDVGCGLCGCLAYYEPGANAARCSRCGLPQFHTTAGHSCANGHVGASPVLCPRVAPGDVDCGNDDCDVCYRAFFDRHARGVVEEVVQEHERRRPEHRGPRGPKSF